MNTFTAHQHNINEMGFDQLEVEAGDRQPEAAE